mgnify:CR=1 FL=1
MSDQFDDPDESDEARIFKVSRRTMLRRTAAGMLGGMALRESAEPRADPTSERNAVRTEADQVRLFIRKRPFVAAVSEVYPVLAGADSRLIAQSEAGWLALWPLADQGRPRFAGAGDCCPAPPIVPAVKPFGQPEGSPATVAEDGQAMAWYQVASASAEVGYRTGRRVSLPLPRDRGKVLCLGLGESGAALAVGFERGGILMFDLRQAEPGFIGEFYDESLSEEHYCARDEVCQIANELPCSCNLVGATGAGRESALASHYDRVTGALITSTMPCGSALPAGATCVCNCVSMPAWHYSHQYCSCDQVCSCDTVCTCDTVSTTHTYTYTYLYPN